METFETGPRVFQLYDMAIGLGGQGMKSGGLNPHPTARLIDLSA